MKKAAKKLLPVMLMIVMLFGLAITTHAADANVIYTNGVEGSGWPYKSAYINTITISGVDVKNYTWTDSNNCDVVLASDTAEDAEITFTITKGGTTIWVNKMSMTLNGTSVSSSGTVQLADGELNKVALYVNSTFANGTKYFNFSIAEPNNIPTLTDSTNTGETAAVVGTEGYQINLKDLFTDADAADTLTYNVSVNGADAVSAEVDENGVYTYSTKMAGTYELVFTATDSKGDTSTDTYTTTLTVTNSEVTYDMTVSVPDEEEYSFYANAGFNEDGTAVDGDELTAVAGNTENGSISYTVSVPENVSQINVYADNIGGMTIDAAEDTSVSMRKVNVTVTDIFNAETSATLKVTYGDSYTATGTDGTYLLETEKEYTFTATPSDTTNYKIATTTVTLEAGNDTAEMTATVEYNNLKTVTTPTGATAEMFRFNNYYNYTNITCRGTKDNGDGTSTHYFAGSSGNGIIYRVSYEDYIVKAGYTSGNVTVTYSESDLKSNARVDYNESTETNAGFTDDGVVLNVNSQNFLSMSVGDTKTLKAYRVWEIIPVSYNNWIIEPDFHFNVVYESTEGVVSITEKANNMTGGESWQTLEAQKEGVAVIEVTYDAVDVRGGSYNGVYGASDPARTGLVVVQVGQSSADVDFGIDCLASQGSVVYEKSTAKAWDAEFDTLYFTGDSGKLNLTPTVTSGTIQSVEVSNDKGNTWTALTAVDDVYTTNIVSGNNIIKVTTSAGTAYQIVRGDKVTYTVEEVASSDSNINDNDGIIEAGETVRVTIDGLHSPIPKMAGNYNPGYGSNTDGYSSHHLSYLFDGERVSGAGSQYNWITAANYIDITLCAEAGEQTLEDGCIGVGIIGLTTFANGGDSHRNIPDAGCSTRGSSTTFNTRSMLPEITIEVAENTTYEITLTDGEGYTLTACEGSESPVLIGGDFSFQVEIADGYKKGEKFSIMINGNETDLALDENNVCVLENITEDMEVTLSGVEKEVILGDADGDEGITSADASLVLRYAASVIDETVINADAADVNGDGTVNSADASLILRYAAGLITEF